MNNDSSRRTRSLLTVGLAIAAVSAATACSAPGSGTGKQGDTIKIGAILPVTGPVAEWGESNTAVLKMLEKEVNADGGIDGKKLDIVIYDSGAKPVEAANLVRKLATKDQVVAIMGPFTSSEAEVAFPVANELNLPITAQASSKPGVAEQNRPWAFRNTIDESVYMGAVAPTVKETLGAKKVAIAYDSADAVGSSIGQKIMPPVLAKSGLDVVNGSKPVTFTTTDIDLKSQVSALASAKPDAIGVGAFYNGAAKLLREMANRDVHTPIFGGSTLVSAHILDAAPQTPIFSAGTYYPGAEKAAEWTDRVNAAFKKNGVSGAPTMFDSQLYEIGQMYVEAIKSGKLGDKDLKTARTGIRDFMTNLKDFPGLTSAISMKPTGDATREFFVIKGEGGSWSVLKTATP